MSFTIKPATPQDASVILELMRELAEYQGISHRYAPDISRLKIQLATTGNPRMYGCLALHKEMVVGYSLYYTTKYSSFTAKWRNVHIEDVYVQSAYRRRGILRSILRHIASHGLELGIPNLSLEVHTENQTAKAIYRRLGADDLPATDWQSLQFTAEAVQVLRT